MKLFFRLLAAMLLCLCIVLPARAEETKLAEDISSAGLITESAGIQTDRLFDGSQTRAAKAEEQSSLTLEDPRGFGSLYLIFDREYGAYTLTNNDTGKS